MSTTASETSTLTVSDYTYQAEAFLSWFRRLPPTEDRAAAFKRWTESKDFAPEDARRIAGVELTGGER